MESAVQPETSLALWTALGQIAPLIESSDTLGTIVATALCEILGTGRVAVILPSRPFTAEQTADAPAVTHFCRPVGPDATPGDLLYLDGNQGILAQLRNVTQTVQFTVPRSDGPGPLDPLIRLASTHLTLVPIPSSGPATGSPVPGAICLLDVPPDRQPSPAELAALASFTGLALRLIQSKATAARQALEYGIISEIGRSLTSSLSLDDIFEQILASVRATIDASEVSVGLIDQKNHEVVFEKSLMGPKLKSLPPLRLKMGQGVAGWVALTGQPLNVPDAYQDPRFFQGVDQASGFVTHSILCVPLTVEDQVIGVLEAVNKRRGHFTEADQRLLAALSSSAAVAIQKAHLHEDVVSEKGRMAAIIANMGEGLMTVTPNGRITTVNPMLEGMLGVDGGALVGTDCRFSIRTDPRVLENLLTQIESPGRDPNPVQAACEVVRPDGSRLPVLLSAGSTQELNGAASEIVIVFSDIAQLRELERMKDDFVANVTHELRTPLATVLLYARLLRAGKTKGDPAREARYLEIIEQQSDHLQRLVRKILDLARAEATLSYVTREPVSLVPICDEVLPPLIRLAQEKGLRVVVRVPSGLPPVMGNPEALKLVLRNLVDNAIKFTPQGTITIAARNKGDVILLSIADQGIGIARESIPHLFQRFYRTRVAVEMGIGGTGLGLALVKEAVDRLGGDVKVRSALGQGSSFTVRLPVGNPGSA